MRDLNPVHYRKQQTEDRDTVELFFCVKEEKDFLPRGRITPLGLPTFNDTKFAWSSSPNLISFYCYPAWSTPLYGDRAVVSLLCSKDIDDYPVEPPLQIASNVLQSLDLTLYIYCLIIFLILSFSSDKITLRNRSFPEERSRFDLDKSILFPNIPAAKLKLNIVVIGAGISGSNAAICLAAHCHRVTLLDYRNNLSGTFANSIHIYPNSARVVDKYGLWPIWKPCRFWQVLREEYVPVMMDVVKKHDVDLRLGCRIQDIDEKVTAVVLDTGERIEADLIVRADGIRSIVRHSVILGGDVPMETSNNAHICRIPKEPILQNLELGIHHERTRLVNELE
ncbi:nucleotide-binding domain-containing protein [Acephala macrosclerotiorum]|nr:nucleotide-binding domain-containing protein [Acephala macrosclerotiorum]